jgi:hypothetical protein
MIEEGVTYHGNNPEFRAFVEEGTYSYASEADLRRFLDVLDAVVAAEGMAAENREEREGNPGDADQEARGAQLEVIRLFDEDVFRVSMGEDIRGQGEAIEAILPLLSTAVRKHLSSRPLVVVLAGETSIGKTSFAVKLAEAINAATGAEFGTIRIDMNQLGERHATSRFWGPPPGYVGYDQPTVFDQLLENPRQVIVCDEMEKGDPFIMNALMNAMASGRMESSRMREDGRGEFDFSKSIMVFTTNVALDVEADATQRDMTHACKQQLRDYHANGYSFSPEIVNRFSEVIVFKPISDDVKREIAELSIVRLARQFELVVEHVDADLLTAFAERCIAEEGVREFEYEAERVFGVAMANYDQEAEGHTVAVTGTIDDPVVERADGAEVPNG